MEVYPPGGGSHGASKVRKVCWDKSERVEVTLFAVAPDRWAAGVQVSARYDRGPSDVLGWEAELAGSGVAAGAALTAPAEGALWMRPMRGFGEPCGPLAYQA